MNQLSRSFVLVTIIGACSTPKADAPQCIGDACTFPGGVLTVEFEELGSDDPQIHIIPLEEFAAKMDQMDKDLAARKRTEMSDQIDASIAGLSVSDQAAIAEVRAALEAKDGSAIARLYATLAMDQKIADLPHRKFWAEILFLTQASLRYGENCDDFTTWVDLYQHSMTVVNEDCVADLQKRFANKYRGFNFDSGVYHHCRDVDSARLSIFVTASNYLTARYAGQYNCFRAGSGLSNLYDLPDAFLPEQDCGEGEPEPTNFVPRRNDVTHPSYL